MYKKIPMGGAVYMSQYEVLLRRLHPQLGPFEGGIAGVLACFGLRVSLVSLNRSESTIQLFQVVPPVLKEECCCA